MKNSFLIIVMFGVAAFAWTAESMTPEEFGKITDDRARREIIAHAPPEERDALEKIDLHLLLLQDYQGEEGLKVMRMWHVIVARGFDPLLTLFESHYGLWDLYTADGRKGSVNIS